jgi:hypothetical protein
MRHDEFEFLKKKTGNLGFQRFQNCSSPSAFAAEVLTAHAATERCASSCRLSWVRNRFSEKAYPGECRTPLTHFRGYLALRGYRALEAVL